MTAIYQALADVMADVQAVAKRDRNTHQNFNFRGIDAVMNAVGPALRTRRVIVAPTVETVAYEHVKTTTGKDATACRVQVTYTFYADDGSSVATSVAGEAWDSGDKACPKAMSVAFRTALLQALCLPTDEPDPDHDVYERATVSVDLSSLDQLIGEAKAKDIAGHYDEMRTYAAQSDGNRDAAIRKLRKKIDLHDSSAAGDGEALAAEAQPPVPAASPSAVEPAGSGGEGSPATVPLPSSPSPDPSSWDVEPPAKEQPYLWREHAKQAGINSAKALAVGREALAPDLQVRGPKSLDDACQSPELARLVRQAIEEATT
jgi:hypothetical protein